MIRFGLLCATMGTLGFVFGALLFVISTLDICLKTLFQARFFLHIDKICQFLINYSSVLPLY